MWKIALLVTVACLFVTIEFSGFVNSKLPNCNRPELQECAEKCDAIAGCEYHEATVILPIDYCKLENCSEKDSFLLQDNCCLQNHVLYTYYLVIPEVADLSACLDLAQQQEKHEPAAVSWSLKTHNCYLSEDTKDTRPDRFTGSEFLWIWSYCQILNRTATHDEVYGEVIDPVFADLPECPPPPPSD